MIRTCEVQDNGTQVSSTTGYRLSQTVDTRPQVELKISPKTLSGQSYGISVYYLFFGLDKNQSHCFKDHCF